MPIPGFYMRRNRILSKKTGNASFLFRLIPCSIFWEFCFVPLPMVQVHIIGSYSSQGTLFAPKTFGMHTNFYGVYLGYWYKKQVCHTSGFWVLNVYSNNSYNMYNPHRDENVAGSRRVLATAVDDWSENLFALAPVQAYAYVQQYHNL